MNPKPAHSNWFLQLLAGNTHNPIRSLPVHFRPVSLPAIILAMAGALYTVIAAALFSTFQVGAFADDARYIVVAQSIATGRGLSLINFPSPIPETVFPPGYPLLLSVLVRLWPDTFVPLQLLSWVATAATLVVLWYMARQMLASRIAASSVVLLYAVHPWVVSSASMVMSEAIYTLFSLVALVLAWRGTGRDKKWSLSVIACAMVVVIAISVRSAGFALFFSILSFLVLQRLWISSLLFTLSCAVFYLPLWLRNTELGGGLISHGYSSFLATGLSTDELGASARNLVEYIGFAVPAFVLPLPGFHEEIPRLLLPLDALSLFVGIGLTILCIFVAARNTTRYWQLVVLYLVTYILILIVYRHQVSELAATTRYLLPLLAIFLIVLAKACEELTRMAPLRGIARTGLALLVVIVLMLYLGRDFQAWRFPIRNRIPDLRIGAVWIATHAPGDAVVATFDPVSTFLYAKRKTVPLLGGASEEFLQMLLDREVDYVLIKPELRKGVGAQLSGQATAVWLPTMHRCPEAFQTVFEKSQLNVTVYALNRWKIAATCATDISLPSATKDFAY